MTRRTVFTAAATLFSAFMLHAAEPGTSREWEDQSVNYVNTEPMRADCAVPSDPDSMMLLNGDWKFHFSLTPEERPADFFRPDFDVSEWGTIPVPSTWEIQGYGTPM